MERNLLIDMGNHNLRLCLSDKGAFAHPLGRLHGTLSPQSDLLPGLKAKIDTACRYEALPIQGGVMEPYDNANEVLRDWMSARNNLIASNPFNEPTTSTRLITDRPSVHLNARDAHIDVSFVKAMETAARIARQEQVNMDIDCQGARFGRSWTNYEPNHCRIIDVPSKPFNTPALLLPSSPPPAQPPYVHRESEWENVLGVLAVIAIFAVIIVVFVSVLLWCYHRVAPYSFYEVFSALGWWVKSWFK